MRYAIKKVPNNPETLAAVSAIVPDGVRITSRRGRGYRRGSYSYYAGLPHKYSAYLTFYCADEKSITRWPWGSPRIEGHDIAQYTYQGMRDGKPVIRAERRDHVARPYQLR